jgi:predicted N-acetyltransferase YhbS
MCPLKEICEHDTGDVADDTRQKDTTMELRPVQMKDIQTCGKVMYEAFRDISQCHSFPPDFPDAEAAEGLLSDLLHAPAFDAFVAEQEGRILGSIFVSCRSQVGGISVLTIDPKTQNCGVGRRLLQHGMEFLAKQGHTRQQIIQVGYHNRSLCLYAKSGFIASELLSNMTGQPIRVNIPSRTVRRASESDARACNALCRKVQGFDREHEVAYAIARGTAAVVESNGQITGYTTGVGFVGHGVGETNEDLKALIASADGFTGPGILIPTGNGELFRWCLENGLRVVQQMTLMDTQPSGPTNGVYWPAVLS